MTHAHLDIARAGRLGIIALDRPDAINALDLGMATGIIETLETWRADDDVRVVVFEGKGPRGFCAGGDVRAIRSHVLAGDLEAASRFFAAEYEMNRVIATYPKPVVALAEGVVMGGGLGIAGHAGFRFTTPGAKFAMPEAAIGFIPDVGVQCILAKAPRERALLFMLAGVPVGAGDARALGLTDCVVPPARLDSVRSAIGSAADAENVDAALVAIMQAEGIDPDPPVLVAAADRLAGPLSLDGAGAIEAAIADVDPELGAVIGTRCPTSLAAILAAQDRARALPDIADVLAMDLRLARMMVGRDDFVEGVRAVLIDKDQKPGWSPARFEDVGLSAIASAVLG
ncbi:enoyl-CoA hydratase/isomerase family protein [Arsenicitalea aurantiaca]|uniref:enoyl-CoA hydratase/isomerase family protein n=1 Tax=Arsenicitalea aurantiaca TaxID=1783274 RepID=UPI0013153109|nr:enoyl-CoA hydratase/isomerase family protein [Arsenicitalea aurantiaca]